MSCSLMKCTDFSEEYITSIFRVEECLLPAFHAGSLLGLHFDLEHGSDTFIRNVD
jgi:hypothetical protein